MNDADQIEALQLQPQESLAQLARGMGHDFNNLLQGVVGALSVAKLSAGSHSPLFGILDLAEQCTDQLQELGQRLVLLAKAQGALNPGEPLAPLVTAAVTNALKGSAVAARFDLAEPLPMVRYEPACLHHLVTLLVNNAKDAMPAGGTLTVAAQACQVEAGGGLPLRPGAYLRLSFQDTGPGIAETVLPRIFEPYFTTKALGKRKGVGLSLPLGQALAHAHGGCLTVEAPAGSGASFLLHLPVEGSTGS